MEKLKLLAKEEGDIKTELQVVKTQRALNADVHAVSEQILANLNRLQMVLEEGSVAEVKAILRAYIGRIEYDPENNRARAGFLRMPPQALLSNLMPQRRDSSFCVVAGGGFEPPTSGL